MSSNAPPSDMAAILHEAAGASDLADRLRLARRAIVGRLVFTTSFGLEDQVLADALAEADVAADWVTLDTGRLFPETYDVWAETERRYGRPIIAIMPDGGALARLVADMGINGFYDSAGNRHACCHLRKVEPLRRGLAGASGWLTGLRSGQSRAREAVGFAAIDATHGILKINPLHDWSRDRLEGAVAARAIPVNRLHARGFASIGCAPCTRAVRPGEDERAGRWWWENDAARECGLHVDADGRLRRRVAEPA